MENTHNDNNLINNNNLINMENTHNDNDLTNNDNNNLINMQNTHNDNNLTNNDNNNLTLDLEDHIPIHKNRKHVYNKFFQLIQNYAFENNINIIKKVAKKRLPPFILIYKNLQLLTGIF